MVSSSGREPRGRPFVWKLALGLALCALLVSQRHRVVGAIRGFSLLPGGLDRAESAAERVRPLLEAEMAALGLKLGDPVFLRVLKEEELLEVWMRPEGGSGFVHYKTYPLCRSAGGLGPAEHEGDERLPEGFYEAAMRSLRPHHRHYLAIEISYPNAYDREHRRPVRPVLVQGDCVAAGSLGLSNPHMEEIYTLTASALEAGQEAVSIHVFPFRLTDRRMNLELANGPPWLEFWANLKEGFDYFEIVGRPPQTGVNQGRYSFE